jgi:hypothetical protein
MKGILARLLGIAILLGFLVGVVLVLTIPYEMHRMASARSWPSRKGVITQSSASPVHRRCGSYRWSFVIRGRFVDNGEAFTLTRVSYGVIRLGRREAYCREVVSRYPSGRLVDVHASSKRPQERILEPFAPWRDLWIALGAGLALVALPGVLYLLRAKEPQDRRLGSRSDRS